MDLQDAKKKTASIRGVLTLISLIVTIAFLLTPKPPILFGIITLTICSISAGFGYGTTYVEKLLKKNPPQNSVE